MILRRKNLNIFNAVLLQTAFGGKVIKMDNVFISNGGEQIDQELVRIPKCFQIDGVVTSTAGAPDFSNSSNTRFKLQVMLLLSRPAASTFRITVSLHSGKKLTRHWRMAMH